jgi:AAHS family 4-hydroxybenzoate transporter-like MFS transporter
MITTEATEAKIATINVQEFINSRKVSRYQMMIIGLCCFIVALDGFDTQTLGYIAPAIKEALRLNPAQLSPLFGLTQIGGMLGAFLFGPLADKIGRKAVVILCVIWFAVFSLASSRVSTIESLTVLRFLTGIGLGGAMPNAITLTAEYCPERKRAFLVTLMGGGYAVAAAIGGLLAAQMVLAWGWQSVFWYGGIVPLIALPLALVFLPESVRYLVLKGRHDEKIARTLERIAPGADFSRTRFVVGEPKLSGSPVKHLFGRGLFFGTVCLWITFCANTVALYFITSWLPTLMRNTGASLTKASILTSTYGSGVIAGSVLLGFLMDRRNPYYVLSAAMFLGSVAIVAIGPATAVLGLLVIALIGAGLGTAGAQTGLAALAADFYPTISRASGVSWAMGVGRVGSIVGAAIGGVMLAAHWGLSKVFVVIAIPLFLASASIAIMYRLRPAVSGSDAPEIHAEAAQLGH